jgi:N-acetylmuramic acid 6-phosphate etherase
MTQPLPPTEETNPRSAGLDALDTPKLVALLADEQRVAVDAVVAAADALAVAVDRVVERIERGGRLHYVGAGTSGRLGVLDAAEIPPTFGAEPALFCAHVAGGASALTRAVEGAEDDGNAGEAAMRACVGATDAVVGISASGGAAYVVRAIECARRIGALTIAFCSSAESALARAAEIPVVLATGAEIVAGSTRMKAGTAQKIALNALSTAVMVRLGKVYDNLMVDVVATNEKLRARAVRLVRVLAAVDDARARELLAAADGRVKVAVVMELRDLDARGAQALLDHHRGFLRRLL